MQRENDYTLDPHTAIGLRAALRLLCRHPTTPVVALATAHPAKFPDAVEHAAGLRPRLPPHLADVMDRPERASALPNVQAEVETFIRHHGRVADYNA